MSSLSRQVLANAIRFLSMDAVQKANSGHPGMPMGMADIAQVLWNDFLKFNPQNPGWSNRDRFVVSNGHGAMLHYSLLHLCGFDVSIEDLKQFRQWHSNTPGHPEVLDTPGVETTTGPLGQGIANAVGMAMAEKSMAKTFNQDGFDIVDHHTYVFLGDGCLMEGISHEVCSLAGTLELGKLIAIYDDNQISIDGDTNGWFTDDTPGRFKAYGWHVIENIDGHDADAILKAIADAKAEANKPTLICCKTKIGFGSPSLEGSEKTHGAPLGDEEIAKTREALNWAHSPFEIPEDIYQAYDKKQQGQLLEDNWNQLFAKYEQSYPELAKEFLRRKHRSLPDNWQDTISTLVASWQQNGQTVASRKASKMVLDHIGPQLPELVGGSADLTGSNLTLYKGATTLSQAQPNGNHVHYGVREFGMSAIMNGMALYGGFIPYGGTFLTFVDYARNALRMSALMRQQVIYVYTHDSIGLGEDGPTHQPIEHLTMLRSTPNVHTWRPCDDVETAVAWQSAVTHQSGPTVLTLSRQNIPHQTRSNAVVENIAKGGYILQDCDGTPDVILIGTGSEVALCIETAGTLQGKGVSVRVVSMPCMELFLAQSQSYQDSVLPENVTKRVAVEAGSTMSWYRFVGDKGKVLGIDTFGASAPANVLFKEYGFTHENLVNIVESL